MKKSKGFTMIEVLTVIAILGIIILLAAPRFLSYIEIAKITQIKNDVKAHENHIESKLSIHPDYIDSWDFISNQQLEELRTSSKLYDRTGLIEESIDVLFTQDNKIIPNKTINTKLKGIFIFDSNGKVYYYDGKVDSVGRLSCENAELQGYICIYTVSDLENINNNLTAKYILMNDIDLGEVELWHPIAHYENSDVPFGGELNGNGYAIKNLNSTYGLNSPYEDEIGLFGEVAYATIKNLTIENFKIQVELDSNRSYHGTNGALMGLSWNTTLENIAVNGFDFDRIKPENLSHEDIYVEYIGSLVGIGDEMEIKDISLQGINIYGSAFLGGMFGRLSESNLENIYANDVFIGETEENLRYFYAENMGGIVGDLDSTNAKNIKIENVQIVGTESIGGFAGSMGAWSASENYTIENISVQAEIKGMGLVGGLVGNTGSNITLNNVDVFANIESLGEFNYDKYVYSFGGLSGNNNENFIVKNAIIRGSIKGMEDVAGVVGFSDGMTTLENVHSSVDLYESKNADKTINEYKNVGGLIGSISLGTEEYLTIKNSSYIGKVFDLKENDYFYPLVGMRNPYSSSEMIDTSNFIVENVYWNKTKNPTISNSFGEGKEASFFEK